MSDKQKDWGHFADGKVHLICSSHNDIAWFDTPAATITWRDVRSITPALDRMAEHDDVKFAMENVLYLLEYLERHPERRDEIHKLTSDKRFDWGGTYNQPYESLLSGEQLVRQTYLGRKLTKKLLPGAESRVYYSPDVPGRAMQMPQILAKSGVPYMVISRHRPSLHYWYSPDGSRVLSWSMGHYGFHQKFGYHFTGEFQEAVDYVHNELSDWDEDYKKRGVQPHFAYMWSYDYIPPKNFDPMIADWKKMREGEDAPELIYSTPERFLDEVTQGDPDLDEYFGERPNLWLYIHGPTHHHAITAKREAGMLLPAAEMFTAINCALEGDFSRYPTHQFDRAWAMSIYDDHGWGGNKGHETDEIFRKKLEGARDRSRVLLDTATNAIAARIKPSEGTPITVFNALSWNRNDPVRAELTFQNAPFKIVDDAGNEVPYQKLSPTEGLATDITFMAEDVPSIGYKNYTMLPGAPANKSDIPDGVTASEDGYENAYYRLKLSPGGIESLFNKTLGQEVLRTEKFLGGEVIMMDSVGNGAGEFGTVQQPSTVGDFERASEYKPEWSIAESGPVYTAYHFTQQLKYAILVQRVVCYHASERVDVEISFYNWTGEKSREYRMMVPVNAKQDSQIAYEVPMGIVEVGKSEVKGAVADGPVYEGIDRKTHKYIRGPEYLQDCSEVNPREVQNFISAIGDDFGVTMSSSVAVCDFIDPTAYSIAPYPILQPILLASRKSCHVNGNWYLQGGEHHFRFSLFAHKPDSNLGRKPATGANNEMRSVVGATAIPGANLPQSHSFASVSGDNVVLTALKKAEDDDDVVVRLVEMHGADTEAKVRINIPLQTAVQTNMIEEGADPVDFADGELSVRIGHHAIETYKLSVSKDGQDR
jgi:alpha-mannosidase